MRRIALLLARVVLPGVCDRHGDRVRGAFCWDGFRWVLCDDVLDEAQKILKNLGLESLWTQKLRERFRKIASILARTAVPNPPLISFSNVVLDWAELLRGNIDGALKKHDPGLWVFNHVPWTLDTELLGKAMRRRSDLEGLFREKAPNLYSAFVSWADSGWLSLLEIIGYTLYPRHGLRKAVLLIGNRWTRISFTLLLDTVLGPENIAKIKPRMLTGFKATELYGKLANIYNSELGSNVYIPADFFKALVGEDYLCIRRNICIAVLAKQILAAPVPPDLVDREKWHVIGLHPGKAIYEFPGNEVEAVVALSIAAFVKAYRRRSLSPGHEVVAKTDIEPSPRPGKRGDTTYRVFFEIYRAGPAGISAKELEKTLGIPKITLWHHVKKLRDKGYVHMVPDKPGIPRTTYRYVASCYMLCRGQ